MTTYAVTGATGKLGRLVLDALIEKTAPGNVVALARDPGKLADYAAQGVQVRRADYNDADSLKAALTGVQSLPAIGPRASCLRAMGAAAGLGVADALAQILRQRIAHPGRDQFLPPLRQRRHDLTQRIRRRRAAREVARQRSRLDPCKTCKIRL